MGKRTRRTFMKDCSTSAAALVALSGVRPADAGEAAAREGTPYLCVTCGTQFSETAEPPAHCPICEDERQYVNPDGQKWTTLDELRSSHKNVIKQEEPDLYSINTEPKFGIGQRAFLIRTDKGNILWDCVGARGRRDDRASARAGRHRRDRDLAPALLHVDGRVEPRVRRRADPPARSRAAVGDAARSVYPFLDGVDARAACGPEARQHRRPF